MNMLSMLVTRVQAILNREEGQDLIEYALLVALISLAATVSIKAIGQDLTGVFYIIGGHLLTSI